MTTWIAFLRAINLGGRNTLPMRELATALEKVGLGRVKTYIQSGNVIFRASGTKAAALAEKISAAVEESHGFRPRVIVLSVDEVARAADANPFKKGEAEPRSLQLYFLAESPEDPDLKSLDRFKTTREAFALEGNVFYLYAPDGLGRSRLAKRVERHLGVEATVRNWRTVSKVLELASQEE